MLIFLVKLFYPVQVVDHSCDEDFLGAGVRDLPVNKLLNCLLLEFLQSLGFMLLAKGTLEV